MDDLKHNIYKNYLHKNTNQNHLTNHFYNNQYIYHHSIILFYCNLYNNIIIKLHKIKNLKYKSKLTFYIFNFLKNYTPFLKKIQYYKYICPISMF